MGVKGLRPPVIGPTRAEKRSAKHSRKVTAKARGGVSRCYVTRNDDEVEHFQPLTIKELSELVCK
jgi:hypothetical protein